MGSIPERVTVKGENRKDFEPTEPLRSRMVVVVTGPHVMKCLIEKVTPKLTLTGSWCYSRW